MIFVRTCIRVKIYNSAVSSSDEVTTIVNGSTETHSITISSSGGWFEIPFILINNGNGKYRVKIYIKDTLIFSIVVVKDSNMISNYRKSDEIVYDTANIELKDDGSITIT